MPERPRLLLTLALVAIAALALGASTASAAPKEVAYVCHGEDICLLDPDNPSDVFNLTDDQTTSFESDPVWSPDGKRLAFVAHFLSPASEDIYTMEPGAPGQGFNLATQITHFVGVAAITEIAWSPDGSKLASVRSAGLSSGSNPVYVVNADGSSLNATVISAASGGGANPTWAPDSAKIAFWHSNQIYTVPGDASGPATPLAGATCREPTWSPDGSKIACGNEFKNIEIFGAGGGSPLTTITNSSQFAFPSWSPSGAQLAYHEQEGGGASYFHIVNADGSGNHTLPIVQELNANGPAPSWSPDGGRLVFQGHYVGGGESSDKVYIANADGTGSVTPLTADQGGGHSTEPAWKPNPIAHPGPQVITPSGGSNGALPGPTIKPKLKWFTKRIFYSEGGPRYIPVLIVFCDAPSCGVGGVGRSKGAVPAGLSLPLRTTTASAKKKPKSVVVASGKVQVPSNQTRVLKLKLTNLAIAILKKVGKLKMAVTVTTTIPGQPPSKETRTVEILFKPKKRH